MAKHTPIEETPVFEAFERCAEAVWKSVAKWPPFPRDTIGKQLVRSIDSVGANLVEGDGRFGDKDALYHFVIARASAREATLWIRRASRRGLISCSTAGLAEELEDATRQLNALINYRRQNAASNTREKVEEFARDPSTLDTQHSTLGTEEP